MSTIHRDVGLDVCDPDGGVQVLHLEEPSDLVRAIGKLHYLCAKENRAVFFRGQTQLFGGSLVPSLLREKGRELTVEEGLVQRENLERYLGDFWDPERRRKHMADGPWVEALLQHYGLRTTWVDVVDTIWPALWFASHFGNHDRRVDGSSELEFRPSDKEFCYVICLRTGKKPEFSLGYRKDEDCEVVDLRKAVSSLFLRPHCQHGCLMRAVHGLPSCWNLVEGVVRLRTEKVLIWLGSSTLSSQSFMFPNWDPGLTDLKRYAKKPELSLGGGFL